MTHDHSESQGYIAISTAISIVHWCLSKCLVSGMGRRPPSPAPVACTTGSVRGVQWIFNQWVQDGAPKIAKLPYKWFNNGLW